MRYILSVLMIVFVALFALQLVTPVGAVTSTVSGEAKLKTSNNQLKKTAHQRKIRMMKAELARTAKAIQLAEKKIVQLKTKNKSVKILEGRLQVLKKKQIMQEDNVTRIESEFTGTK